MVFPLSLGMPETEEPTRSRPMEMNTSMRKSVIPTIATWIGLLILWILFSGSLDGQELVAGAVISAFAAIIVAGQIGSGWRPAVSLRRLLYLFGFLVYLAVAVVRSNLQMAAIVLSPRLHIRPGIVRVKTRLKSPVGRLILANAITLTPGTLTVDADGEDFFIHWVNVEAEDAEEATAKIVSGFETYLEVICG
jgi:multicomponent Na+:H+ antiporter subunit E